jgi:Holliday junction resolvase RusA-like endonuclease
MRLTLRPKPKERARGICVRCLGRKLPQSVRMYTPKTTEGFEKAVGAQYKSLGGEKYSCPVTLIVSVDKEGVTFEVIPDSESKSSVQGDIDNYVKAVSDGLNGIAYDDDKLVHTLVATKGNTSSSDGLWARLRASGLEACSPARKGSEEQADGGSAEVGGKGLEGFVRGRKKTASRYKEIIAD